jgi:glutathione S-transferase
MELHYGRVSGNSARAVFALLESGAAHTLTLVDTTAGENQSPGYKAINPMGKIPSLTDGAFKLWESNAIGLYAAGKNPACGLIPSSEQGRASMQRWLFFQAAHVSPPCVPLFRALHPLANAFWKVGKVDLKELERPRAELARFLPVLDEAVRGRDFLEEKFSLADIAYAPHLWLISQGVFDLSPYPALQAWLGRVWARPAWQRTQQLVFGS